MSPQAKNAWYLLLVYLAMILGMVAKTFFDHFTKNLDLHLGNFLIPLLVSPLVYGVVFNAAKSAADTVTILIFGFQNGFFWQTVFGELAKHAGAG